MGAGLGWEEQKIGVRELAAHGKTRASVIQYSRPERVMAAKITRRPPYQDFRYVVCRPRGIGPVICCIPDQGLSSASLSCLSGISQTRSRQNRVRNPDSEARPALVPPRGGILLRLRITGIAVMLAGGPLDLRRACTPTGCPC